MELLPFWFVLCFPMKLLADIPAKARKLTDIKSSVLENRLQRVSRDSEMVRVVNGSTPYEGRVEIFTANNWWSPCDLGWNLKNGDVVCRWLGMGYAISAQKGSYFGTNLGSAHLNGKFECVGTEIDLWNCDTDQTTRCSSIDHDVGVTCSNQDRSEGSLRLADGYNNGGRLEIYIDHSWGTICDLRWNFQDAHVACKQLGFSTFEEHKVTTYPRGNQSQNVWMDDLFCERHSGRLIECLAKSHNLHYCGHHMDVSLVCSHKPAAAADMAESPSPDPLPCSCKLYSLVGTIVASAVIVLVCGLTFTGAMCLIWSRKRTRQLVILKDRISLTSEGDHSADIIRSLSTSPVRFGTLPEQFPLPMPGVGELKTSTPNSSESPKFLGGYVPSPMDCLLSNSSKNGKPLGATGSNGYLVLSPVACSVNDIESNTLPKMVAAKGSNGYLVPPPVARSVNDIESNTLPKMVAAKGSNGYLVPPLVACSVSDVKLVMATKNSHNQLLSRHPLAKPTPATAYSRRDSSAPASATKLTNELVQQVSQESAGAIVPLIIVPSNGSVLTPFVNRLSIIRESDEYEGTHPSTVPTLSHAVPLPIAEGHPTVRFVPHDIRPAYWESSV